MTTPDLTAIDAPIAEAEHPLLGHVLALAVLMRVDDEELEGMVSPPFPQSGSLGVPHRTDDRGQA